MLVISARKGEFETGFERGGQVIVFAIINAFIGSLTQKKSHFDPDNGFLPRKTAKTRIIKTQRGFDLCLDKGLSIKISIILSKKGCHVF